MQLDVVVAIGRRYGNGGRPMDDQAWETFRLYVLVTLRKITDSIVHANIVGDAVSGEYGEEESAWYAATVPAENLDRLRTFLGFAAKRWGQESIALTVGKTEFVEG